MQISFIELNWIENHTLQALNYIMYLLYYMWKDEKID